MSKSTVSAASIFEQAGYFYQALNLLQVAAPHPRENLHGAVTLVAPCVVLGAFTTELFLKCLICIETDQVPRGHDLKRLFDGLSVGTQASIEKMWNAEVVPLRSKEWDRIEQFGLKIPRDLPAALAKGSDAFKRIRYSYEGDTEGVHFYVGDLPGLLERIILEKEPTLEAYRRKPLSVPSTYQ